MDDIYYDTKTGFVGFPTFWRRFKIKDPSIPHAEALAWFRKQAVNQIHYNNKKRKQYLPIYSIRPLTFQVDLAFLYKYKRVNRGYKIMMTCINVNTRKAYVYKAKHKDQQSILPLIKLFIKESGCKVVSSDNGKEFIAKETQDFCRSVGVEWNCIEPGDHHKNGKIERFNRTLKERLEKIFTRRGKPVWYDVLDDVVANYNNTVHSAIKMKPNDVTVDDEKRIVKTMIEKTHMISLENNIIPIGSQVRVRVKKEQFDKGDPKFSVDLYEVDSVTMNGTRYTVRKNGKLMKKKYHPRDLLPVDVVENNVDDKEINKVIRKHKQDRFLRKEGLDESNILPGRRKLRKDKLIGQVFTENGTQYVVTAVRLLNGLKTVFYRAHPNGAQIFTTPYKDFKIGAGIVGDTYSYATGDEFPGERHAVLMTPEGMRKAQFMGPGTHVLFRLRRGDKGLTPCDMVARRHDIDYALAGTAKNKEQQILMVRRADQRMVRKLNEIAEKGLDYQVNIQQGRLISAKMKMEDYGIMNKGSFSGDLRYYKPEDYVLLIQEREKMIRNGY